MQAESGSSPQVQVSSGAVWCGDVLERYTTSKLIRFFAIHGSAATLVADSNQRAREWTWRRFPTTDKVELSTVLFPRRGFFGFTGLWNSKEFAILMPIWFLVLLSGVITAVTWIRGAKRFSLLTLLIATTLIAVALGWWCGRCNNPSMRALSLSAGIIGQHGDAVWVAFVLRHLSNRHRVAASCK